MSEVSQAYRQADWDRIEALRLNMEADPTRIGRYQWLAEINHRRYEYYRESWDTVFANAHAVASAWWSKRAREAMGIE